MLEFPEVITLSKQLNENCTGRTAVKILPPTKEHKFCWYNGEPESYNDAVSGRKIVCTEGFGIYVDTVFDNGLRLSVNDGVNCRLVPTENLPKAYQLAIELDDGNSLVYTVAMYGGICLHDESYDNPYYCSSKKALSLISSELPEYYYKTLENCKQNLSVKAFLATEQRFSGLGNGVLQDILYTAGLNPKRKISLLSGNEKDKLLNSVSCVLKEMTELGGRDTEKDLFGKSGGYKTLMSKNTVGKQCDRCGSTIVKEAYLGGSVYYCPVCQPK